MIIGPTLLGRYFTSGELLKKMLGGRMKMPGTVKIMIPMVDVRDAAKAHLLALDRPEARNRRFIISQGALWVKEIALFMKESFPDYSIRAKDLSYCPLKLASLFN